MAIETNRDLERTQASRTAPAPAGETADLRSLIARNLNRERFANLTWEGTFWDYLDLVRRDPMVARNAFQRVYDMILSYGTEQKTLFKEDCAGTGRGGRLRGCERAKVRGCEGRESPGLSPGSDSLESLAAYQRRSGPSGPPDTQ